MFFEFQKNNIFQNHFLAWLKNIFPPDFLVRVPKGLLHGFRASRVPLGIDHMGFVSRKHWEIAKMSENGADALASEITILDAKTAGWARRWSSNSRAELRCCHGDNCQLLSLRLHRSTPSSGREPTRPTHTIFVIWGWFGRVYSRKDLE